MNSHTPVCFTLSLIESSGLFGQVGRPNLFCWASAFHLPVGAPGDGRIVVLSREPATDNWREYAGTLSAERSRTILELLIAMGMPGRSPDVEGVVDTSDGWSQITLHTNIEGRHSQLDVSMHSSGFDGVDAARLRGLFRLLFELAGYEGHHLTAYGAA